MSLSYPAFGLSRPQTTGVSDPMSGISLVPFTSLIAGNGDLFPGITVTRAGATKTYFDSTGTLQTMAANTLLPEYDPSTLAYRGPSVWESRTNSIRNNTMVGASAPSTLPTNWSFNVTTNNLTREVVGTGADNGIEYIDVRISGTPSATSGTGLFFEASTQVAASSGQTWTDSVYLKLQAGSLTNVGSLRVLTIECDAAGAMLASTAVSVTPTGNELRTQRTAATRTFSNGSTAFARPAIDFAYTNGQAIDFTLRIGLPQLELGAFATPVIKTSTVAVTRNADVAVISSLAGIGYNAAQGTLVAQFIMSALGSSTTTPCVVSINDGSLNNRTTIAVRDATDDKPRFAVVAGGVVSALIDTTVVATANTLIKSAASWASNSFRFAVNGIAGTEDVSGTVAPASELNIGYEINANYINGWLPSLSYYPTQLPQATLNSLTA